MDILVVSKKDNVLLGRTEVRFRIAHPKEKSPDRDSVREKLAAILNEKKELVIIDSMKGQFGKQESAGYAKVYKLKEQAMKIERSRTLVRNKLMERKAKAAKEKAPAKPEARAEARAEPKAPPKPEARAEPRAEAKAEPKAPEKK